MPMFAIQTNVCKDAVPDSLLGDLTQQLAKATGKPAQVRAGRGARCRRRQRAAARRERGAALAGAGQGAGRARVRRPAGGSGGPGAEGKAPAGRPRVYARSLAQPGRSGDGAEGGVCGHNGTAGPAAPRERVLCPFPHPGSPLGRVGWRGSRGAAAGLPPPPSALQPVPRPIGLASRSSGVTYGKFGARLPTTPEICPRLCQGVGISAAELCQRHVWGKGLVSARPGNLAKRSNGYRSSPPGCLLPPSCFWLSRDQMRPLLSSQTTAA